MSSQDSQEQSRDFDRLDVGKVKRFLVRRWTLILGTACAAVILALVACLSAMPIYTATSEVLLDLSKQPVFGQNAVPPGSALDSMVDNQIPVVLSTRTLSSVVSHEHLAENPEFAQAAEPGLSDWLVALFTPPRAANVERPSLAGIEPKLAPAIYNLFDHVDVRRAARSSVLSITAASREPRDAARLANTMAQAYVADQVDVHARSSQRAATFFEDRISGLRDQVRLSERAVAEFRNKNGLATTSDDKGSVGGQKLNERLAAASSETAETLAKYQQAARFKGSAGDTTLPEVARSPVIDELRAQQAEAARREADLAVTYGNAYPAVAQTRALRQRLNTAVAVEMKRLVVTLKNDYEAAKAREESLRKETAAIGNLPGGDNDVAVKLHELERTNLANKTLLETFLDRDRLTREQFETPDARIVSPALESPAPSSPDTKLILPVAGIAGLLLGLGLAVGFDLYRNRTHSALLDSDRSSRHDEVPILGYVPVLAKGARGGRGATHAARFMARQPLSDFARGIDDLALRLMPFDGEPAPVVMLAPLAAGEGSSTIARCLATTLGRSGKRVLLIDADDVQRSLSIGLSMSSHPGLSDVLAGAASIASAVVPQQAFAFLSVGQRPFDPAARSVKRNLRGLLQEARGRFDIVLVDGPAFYESGNAKAWLDLIDGLSIVARWDQLLQPRFVATVDAVTALPHFAGLILNRTNPPAAAEDFALAS